MKTIITLLFIIAFSITGKSQAYYYTGVVNGRPFTVSGYSSYGSVMGNIPGYGAKAQQKVLKKMMKSPEFKRMIIEQNSRLDSVSIVRRDYILDSLANKKLLSN